MPTPVKAKIIEDTQAKFQKCSGIYFTNYKGINVAQITKLRDMFREEDVDFKVTRNTLTRIAAENSGYHNLKDLLAGMIAIAYADSDPTAPARVIKKFKKEGGELDVVGILFEGELFGPEKYKELADLPSKEELISKLLAGLSYPMSHLASTLGGAMSKLARTLESLKEKKA